MEQMENKQTKWYKEAVVYQIYPFSFMDSNNDGWGDIPGICSKLDYLKELGITAIWFSPLYKSPCYDYGYDIADYRDIDPKFGTLEDFKGLVEQCHSRGIKVIMDMAINHSSIEHPWFLDAVRSKESPYRDYYIIREGKRKKGKLLPPTNWDSTFTGKAWERIPGTDDFYLHLFCVEQADLNWENPAVRREAVEIFRYWMDMGVDGFRLGVFNMFSKAYPLRDGKKKLAGTGEEYYVDGPRMHEFLKQLNREAFSLYDSYTVGESFNPHPEDAYAYVKEENRELDTIFNFDHLASDNIGGAKFFQKPFSMKQFKRGLLGHQIANYQNGGWNTLVLENHDNCRSNSRFGISTKKFHYEASTFLPTIAFLGFGTPFIYMGEEFGMTGVKFQSLEDMKDPVTGFVSGLLTKYGVPKKLALRFMNFGARDHARVPMQWDDGVNAGFNSGHTPWQCLNGNYPEHNLKKDLESEKSVFRYYQRVIALKKTELGIYGDICEYDRSNRHILCYARRYEGETMLVFGNFSGKARAYTLPEAFQKLPYEVLLNNYDGPVLAGGVCRMRPYEAVVLKYKG